MTQTRSIALLEFENALLRLTRYYTDKVWRYENEMDVARSNEPLSFQEILIDQAKEKLNLLQSTF